MPCKHYICRQNGIHSTVSKSYCLTGENTVLISANSNTLLILEIYGMKWKYQRSACVSLIFSLRNIYSKLHETSLHIFCCMMN